MTNSWYAPLAAVQSLGQLDRGPGSLAGLHEARKRHLSQFFTPSSLAGLVWELASRAMPATDAQGMPRRYSVLDNSVGSGRLLQFADPSIHKVGGIDVHAETIVLVKEVFAASGFGTDFHTGSMEAARPSGWSVAVLNPPFSIQFESPLLKGFASNTFGKFGPRTSARSDNYALEQALAAADVVVAILPRSMGDRLERGELCASGVNEHRLRAIFDLPTGTFREEGAEVEVCVAAFGLPCKGGWAGRHALQSVDQPIPLTLAHWEVRRGDSDARIRWKHLDDAQPAITLPVTGNKVVSVAHDGRRLRLKFQCGFTQARVLNAVLVKRNLSELDERLPRQYPYTGSSRLDLEAHLATGEPVQSIEALLADIRAADAEVEVAPGFWEHLRRRQRRSQRQATPLSHVVWDSLPADAAKLEAVARKPVFTDPSDWFAWVIEPGTALQFVRQDDGKYVTRNEKGDTYCVTVDQLHHEFVVSADRPAEGWREAHPGLLRAYPQLAGELRKRALGLGIDKWLSWKFQLDDLVELLLKPQGSIAAWDTGLGKTRLAAALILLSGVKHGLVSMDAYLVLEFAGKLAQLPIDRDEWQIIDEPSKLKSLKRINLISYERLRMPVAAGSKVTYAHRMRRRIGMLLADEGEILANAWSAQSAALWRISARRRYILSATPLPNYPRDSLPIMAFCGGDGTAAQPWGYHGPYMYEGLAKSAAHSQRGIDAFREEFVTLEWTSDEFAEDLRNGAKREVPKIGNLAGYRAALAPHIKRRVTDEPAVQQYVKIPVPDFLHHTVEFDDAHLGYYLTVAESFAEWWAQNQEAEGKGRKVSSLLKILLKIGAVVRANNNPQRLEKGSQVQWRGGLTAKQRFTLDRMETLVGQGEKVIVLCHSPVIVELFHREMAKRGVDAVRFHGGIPIARRYEAMDKGFRKGGVPLLLGTLQVTQAGMDLPQASRVLFYDRDWSYKAELQALRRALRPQTDHPVVVETVHHAGSIDDYQGQMCSFKKDAFRAGLDWATPELADAEFEHLGTIIGRFLSELAALRGKRSWELQEELKRLAA